MLDKIRETLIDYVHKESIVFIGDREEIPLDISLIEAGLLDSYGIIELVAFIEDTWNITIEANDFTKEKMGSINLMAKLIRDKTEK